MFFNIKEIADKYIKKIKIFRYFNYKTKNQYKIFNHFKLNQNSLFLDFGANKGEVTQYVKDTFNCKTASYEPDSYCFNKLKERFDNKKNKIYNLGISLNLLKAKLYYHKKFKGNNYIYSQSSSLIKTKSNISKKDYSIINTLPIKKLLSKYNFIDLIKIDIEGYEYEILPEIIKNKKKIKYVLCELHGNPNIKDKNGNIKHPNFTKKYKEMKSNLKKKKLLGNWFVEWV